MSVLEKANRLQGIARTYAEGAAQRREREQAAVALKSVEDALAKLRLQVHAARAAEDVGIQLADVGRLAGDGLANLHGRAAVGVLPSAQALQAARRKIESNDKVIDAELASAWKSWTDEKISAIPAAKVALTAPADRRTVEENLVWLRSAARHLPSAEDVRQFRQKHERICAILDAVRSDAAIVRLLERITANGLVLADVTDDELHLLRGDATAARQIVLRAR
jgi:hypothetical protein